MKYCRDSRQNIPNTALQNRGALRFTEQRREMSISRISQTERDASRL